MHFDLVDLRLFTAVAEAGSMAEAARRESISVSALHERMKLLEERAGVPLMARTVRGTKVTAAGAVVLSRAKGVLHQAERLPGRGREPEAPRDGHDQAPGELERADQLPAQRPGPLPRQIPWDRDRSP